MQNIDLAIKPFNMSIHICLSLVIADDTVCVWYIASTLVILRSSSKPREGSWEHARGNNCRAPCRMDGWVESASRLLGGLTPLGVALACLLGPFVKWAPKARTLAEARTGKARPFENPSCMKDFPLRRTTSVCLGATVICGICSDTFSYRFNGSFIYPS